MSIIPNNTRISSELTILELISFGAYARVYKVIFRGNIKALRIPIKEPQTEVFGLESVIDLDILTRIKHPNIMYAEDLIHNPEWGGISVIMPYAGKTLVDINNTLSLAEAYSISYKIICAAEHLLDNNLLYLDIKPNNILFRGDGNGETIPMLADFNIVARMDHFKTPVLVRKMAIMKNFRPYEVLCKNNMMGEYTLVWQLGVLLLFIFGKTYIVGDNEKEVKAYLEQYFIGTSTPHQLHHSMRTYLKHQIKDSLQLSLGIDLLSGMLNTVPNERFTLKDVLKHSFWKIMTSNPECEVSELKVSLSEGNHSLSKETSKSSQSTEDSKNNLLSERSKKVNTIWGENLKAVSPHLLLQKPIIKISEEAKKIIFTESIKRLYNMIGLSSYLKRSRHIPVGILFSGMDLIKRTIHSVFGSTDKVIITHNIACNIVAWKLYQFRLSWKIMNISYEDLEANFITNNFYAKKYIITIKEVIAMETEIILLLKGRLFNLDNYDSIPGNMLTSTLDNLLKEPEDKEKSLAENTKGKDDLTSLMKKRGLFPLE